MARGHLRAGSHGLANAARTPFGPVILLKCTCVIALVVILARFGIRVVIIVIFLRDLLQLLHGPAIEIGAFLSFVLHILREVICVVLVVLKRFLKPLFFRLLLLSIVGDLCIHSVHFNNYKIND